MKKRFYTLLSLLFTLHISFAQQQWTWVGGTKAGNARGSYGVVGIPSPTNSPGSRVGATTWKDNNGNFWLFGGRGWAESANGLLNDLWRYNPSNNQWTWMGGDKGINTPGRYGILGIPLFQSPGARENAVSWTDNQGNFWMFGGSGLAVNDETGYLNDLWKYTPATNEWAWVSGSNRIDREGEYGDRGQSDNDNIPGGRYMSTGWKDASGNFWLFGGFGIPERDDKTGAMNDVWRYSPNDNEWIWMKGEKKENGKSHYGEKGDFKDENTPGARQGATGWTDKEGNFWLYGGGNSSDISTDLWKYNPAQNQWAWMSGVKDENQRPEFDGAGIPTSNGHPGSRMLAAGWIDPVGDLWLFGGSGYGGNSGDNPLNSTWKYSLANNTWTFVKGEVSTNPQAVFGTRGTPTDKTTPGGSNNSLAYVDEDGMFWLFGGQSNDGLLNQFWKFSPCQGGSISPTSAAICEGGAQVLTATGGSQYEWRRNNEVIAGQTQATLNASQPGIYSAIVKNDACAVPASNTAEITRATAPTGNITPASATICQGGSKVLTATGGTSYEWKRNNITIPGQTGATYTATEAGIYSVIITNGTCQGPASNTTEIIQDPTPAGTISPESASICNGSAVVLLATGGTSYEWQRDGETLPGETSATISVTVPGIYSVIIKGGACSGSASNTSEVVEMNNSGTRYADVFTAPNVPVQLSARVSGISYEWLPYSGLDDPTSATPKAKLESDREYTVRITNEQGCSIVDTQLVKVNANVNNSVKVFVPTAFTPNGNNVNDRLRPLGNISRIDYFKVYNRWGVLVYQTKTLGEGWDGSYKGNPQQSDTYTWVFQGQGLDGQAIKGSGKTLLIR
jgi:gliding motility-associated-like protein